MEGLLDEKNINTDFLKDSFKDYKSAIRRAKAGLASYYSIAAEKDRIRANDLLNQVKDFEMKLSREYEI